MYGTLRWKEHVILNNRLYGNPCATADIYAGNNERVVPSIVNVTFKVSSVFILWEIGD